MNPTRLMLALCWLAAAPLLHGQPPLTDTVFLPEQFLQVVAAYHPVARQAELLGPQADAELLKARGGFDPKLSSNVEQKSFNGSNYFTVNQNELKIPTWYGVELKAGFHYADGVYLNPEFTLPPSGQAIAGISVPLLREFVIDERRTALAQARLWQQYNEAERQRLLNDLLMDAAEHYWAWTFNYNQLNIAETAIDLAEQRFEALKISFEQGDKAGVDTLEALIQLQTRRFDYNEALLAYQNAGLALQAYLWDGEGDGYALPPAVRPPTFAELQGSASLPATASTLLASLVENHPTLRGYQVKLQQLENERRLKAEMLKPELRVEYNLLGEGWQFGAYNGDGNGVQNFLLQNYKWGLRFNMPLLLRKERGSLEQARLKIQDTQLEYERKVVELENKLLAAYNDLNNTLLQIQLFGDMVGNYERLLAAENLKFSIGESSLFLINSREVKLIEARLKLAKLESEFYKNLAKIAWTAGLLAE